MSKLPIIAVASMFIENHGAYNNRTSQAIPTFLELLMIKIACMLCFKLLFLRIMPENAYQ